jgi:hypothetical protein
VEGFARLDAPKEVAMRMLRSLVLLPAALLAVACGSAGTDDPNGPATALADYGGGTSGGVQIRLVDAPNIDVKEIVVTITHVDAHVAGTGWVRLVSTKQTVDLLTLQGGNFSLLGITQLPVGRITQFRLYVDEAGPNYVTTPDKKQHPLEVPSGVESGIKLKAGFDVQPCAQGQVTLDFDGKNSIFAHPKGAGAGDQWLLRPVVRLKAVVLQGSCSDGGTGGDGGGSGGDGGSTGSDGGGSGGDGGTTTVTDGGTPPPPPPINDPCANVLCPLDTYCLNGTCAVIPR